MALFKKAPIVPPAPPSTAPSQPQAVRSRVNGTTVAATRPTAPNAFAQPLRAKRKPTGEQEEICASNAGLIVANAYAGTGKTSTYEFYTEMRPSERFLYVAFSKALQVEAEARFGTNTVCKTTHALAFAKFGATYKHKLNNIRPFDISSMIGCEFIDARRALDTLNNFLCSTDSEIREWHMNEDVLKSSSAGRVFDLARQTWKEAQDVGSRMPMPHDGYLKLFVMSDPDLSWKFDTILFDEAQDANPVTTQLVMAQATKGCRVLMVGDRYQSIFGFRGAENAMESVNAMIQQKGISDVAFFDLTQSFRFGKGIADLATNVLSDFRGAQKPLVGLGAEESVFDVDYSKPYMRLCRTNGSVFRSSVDAMMSQIPFLLVTGTQNYQFDRIHDMYRLYANVRHEIKDPFLKRLSSFEQAQDYASQTDDREMQSMIKIVEEYRTDIPGLITDINLSAIQDEPGKRDNAVIRITTAHRSKGLEFDQVVMHDDFADLIEDDMPLSMESRENREEVHLTYVALTRAKRALEISPQLGEYQKWRKAQPNLKSARKTEAALSL